MTRIATATAADGTATALADVQGTGAATAAATANDGDAQATANAAAGNATAIASANDVTVNASTTGNTTNISGGTVTNVAGGEPVIVDSIATATANAGGPNTADATANVDNVTVNASATNNTINISGGTVTNAAGGSVIVEPIATAIATGDTATATADVNNVTVNASATGNTVNISGGTVTGNVAGGSVTVDSIANGNPGTVNASATNNTVNISGNANLAAANLYGGRITGMYVGAQDAFTGNTLNVRNFTSRFVGGIQNFQFFNFYFNPADYNLNTQALLEVVGTADLTDGNGRTSEVQSISTHGGTPLPRGAKVTLIEASNNLDIGGAANLQKATSTGVNYAASCNKFHCKNRRFNIFQQHSISFIIVYETNNIVQ